MQAKQPTQTTNATEPVQASLDFSGLPSFLPQASRSLITEHCEATGTPIRPFKTLQNLSERLEWRIARFYRDICFLFGLRDSQAKGYVFAETSWFTKKYEVDPSTLRNWQKVLVDNGWLLNLGKGPQRRLIPLVHPKKVLSFFARFSRLFKGVFSGFWGRYTYTPEREENSNRTHKPAQKQACKRQQESRDEGTGHDSVVVATAMDSVMDPVIASLVQSGIASEKQARKLIVKAGIEACLDQIEALPYREAKKPGAVLYDSIMGNWCLPDGLIEKREQEKRREAKREQLAAQREAEEARKVERTARLTAEQEARRAAQEAEQTRFDKLAAPALVPAWKKVKEQLNPDVTASSALNKPTYLAHVEKLIPIGIEGEKVTLGATSSFSVSWLSSKAGILAEAWSEVLERPVFVVIEHVRS